MNFDDLICFIFAILFWIGVCIYLIKRKSDKENSIKDILDKTNELLDNKLMVTRALNYIEECDENFGIYYIDYMINFPQISAFKFKYSNNLKPMILENNKYLIQKEYYKMNTPIKLTCNIFTTELWQDIQSNLIEIIKNINSNNFEINTEYDEVNQILNYLRLMIDTRQIKNDFESIQAFLLFLWFIQNLFLENKLNFFKQNYNLDDCKNLKDINDCVGGFEHTITYLAINKYTNRRDNTFLNYKIEAENNVNNYIKNLQNIKKLEQLTNGIKTNKITIEDIDFMDGYEFEDFVSKIFKKMGYVTQVTKSSGDQGIDVLAIKDNIKIAIQAKCYSGNVGNHAVMEAVAGMKFYDADKCMVITNSMFTKSAKELANINKVILWDRNKLIQKLEEIELYNNDN